MTGVVWRGPESLRPLLVPLSAVGEWPDNPRQGDVGAVAASLARFGQQKPIVVQRSTGWTIAGNHTLRAIPLVDELERAMGLAPHGAWSHVAVVFSELEDDAARAYAIADNRISELGSYDDDALARILVELASAGQLAGTGYDEDDLDNLIASLNPVIPAGALPPVDGKLGSEVRVEIGCTLDFLEKIRPTLEDWRRDGAEVTIA
jgi:ParB-like chromosome segregation protein Spo0J